MLTVCIPTTAERRQRLAKCIESLHKYAGVPFQVLTYENYQEGFVLPIHKMLATLKDGTPVWCIGDDTILIEPDTIKRLFEEWMIGGADCVVNPNDGIQNGTIITMPFCSALTMRKYTYTGYFLNYADNEFTEIMRSEGRYIYRSDIHVDHQHHVNGKAPVDGTYSYALTKFDDDRKLYQLRKARGFQPRNLI